MLADRDLKIEVHRNGCWQTVSTLQVIAAGEWIRISSTGNVAPSGATPERFEFQIEMFVSSSLKRPLDSEERKQCQT